MEQDIIRPETQPKPSTQGFSPLGCSLAAIGAALSTLTLVGAALAASVWALTKLLGLPDTILYVLLALALIPVLWATFWVGGRAWHIERRLAAGHDVDTPIFSLLYYFKAR